MNVKLASSATGLVLLAVVMLSLSSATGRDFDFSGWYHDAVSLCGSPCLDYVKACHDSMQVWCDSIGLGWVAVQYRDSAAFATLTHDMSVLNTFLPPEVTRYSNASYWYVTPWNALHDCPWNLQPNQFAADSNTHAICADGDSTCFFPADSGAQIMWKPSCIGTWNGWQGREDPFMPVHFRITCGAGVVDSNAAAHPVIARVHWLMKTNSYGDWCPFDTSMWWVRYPAIAIPVDSFETDGEDTDLRTLDFTFVPSYDTSRTFDTVQFNPAGEVTDSGAHGCSHSFKGTRWARVMVTFEGFHSFRLHKIEMWDEHYHRLLVEPDPSIASVIRSELLRQYNWNPTHHGGWMSDDKGAAMLRQALQVMHLAGGGFPPWVWSSARGDPYYKLLDSMGLPHPIEACETYWFGADSTLRPSRAYMFPLSFLYTDTSTDVTYLRIDSDTSATDCPVGWYPTDRYNGVKSLQFAVDEGMWGWTPYASRPGTPAYPWQNWCNAYYGWVNDSGLTRRVRYCHDHDARFWSILQSGRYDAVNDNCADMFPSRTPTPNEVKMSAWIAVGCDVDGIMWYGTVASNFSEGLQYHVGGLFQWVDQAVPPDLTPTPNYYAAADVQGKILSIAPVFKTLDFVHTYASRAFEQNYPDTTFTCPWIALDVLRDSSAVEYIRTSKPGNPMCGWNPEDASETYVQVSRFTTPGMTDEDYWFLIVNRRALSTESRKVELGISNAASTGPYLVERLLARTCGIAPVDSFISGRIIEVTLDPGEAEFVHFTRLDTTDWIIEDTTAVLKAPMYLHRNLILRNAKVTIVPDTAALKHAITRGDSTAYRWDSVATITFWEGKGIQVIHDDTTTCLRVLGNDSIRVRLQPAATDQRWAGIEFAPLTGDTLDLRYADVSGATCGIYVMRGDPLGQVSATNCRLFDNGTAIRVPGLHTLTLDSCEIADNDNIGVFCWNGVHATVTGCTFSNNHGRSILLSNGVYATLRRCTFSGNENRSIEAINGCTLDLERTSVLQNGTSVGQMRNGAMLTPGGIRTQNSDVFMKCCQVQENVGHGIEMCGGSLVMAEPGHGLAIPKWGGNQVSNNYLSELSLYNLTRFVLADGQNAIFDSMDIVQTHDSLEEPHASCLWIDWQRSDDAIFVHHGGNYWGGLTDSAKVARWVKSDYAPLSPILSQKPVEPDACAFPPPTGIDGAEDCVLASTVDEFDSLYAEARLGYEDLIEAATDSCPRGSAVNRLLAVNLVAGLDQDSMREFLHAVADTTADMSLRYRALMGIALSVAGAGDLDSAEAMYCSILDSAGENVARQIDAEVGLLTVHMSAEEADTLGNRLTEGELTAYLDTLDTILGKRFVWTQYQITDSVVMYAPCRVDSMIWIEQGGVLVIRPHPGVTDPQITFCAGAVIWVNGPDMYQPQGKCYVLGTPESRVIMVWDTAGEWGSIYSYGGYVEMKHAELRGRGFGNMNDACVTQWAPVFKADSCTFRTFDEGIWCYGTGAGSYLRNCLLDSLGVRGFSGMDYGTALSIYYGGQLDVENCEIRNSGDVGMMVCGYSYGTPVSSTKITGSGAYGLMNWWGYGLTLECCEVTSNGDSLAEIWVDEGWLDLTGAHTLVADSSGILIRTADPSFVDIADGENGLELWTGEGTYLYTDDTTSNWDVTWNTWTPASPADSDFYEHLYPSNPNRWLVDSSLAEFVACEGGGGAASLGGPIIVTGSGGSDYGTDAWSPSTNPDEVSMHTVPGAPSASPSQKAESKSSVTPDKGPTKSGTLARRRQMHEQELAGWREVKQLIRSKDKPAARDAAMRFALDHPGSPLEPAALVSIAGLAEPGKGSRVSDFLKQRAKSTTKRETQKLAQRLALQALAVEGQPAEALASLEELVETAETPRDSIRALADATGVCFFYGKQAKLEPRHDFVRTSNVREFSRRLVELAKLMDNPTLAASKPVAKVPTEYKLYQNYPNPFNPNTEIRFDLPEAVRVELKVFNILGQEVITLLDEVWPAGAYRVMWDSKSASGISVASGVFVYQLKAGSFTDAKKMVLIR